MHCLKCGGEYRQRKGSLRIQDALIGEYIVYEVDWKECPHCKKRSYPLSTVEKMEAAEREARDVLLQNQPLSNFMTATEVADTLDISRQALHKHRRIRRGFIYATLLSDKKVYLRKSVEAYKATGDGRVRLYNRPTPDVNKLIWCEAATSLKAVFIDQLSSGVFAGIPADICQDRMSTTSQLLNYIEGNSNGRQTTIRPECHD